MSENTSAIGYLENSDGYRVYTTSAVDKLIAEKEVDTSNFVTIAGTHQYITGNKDFQGNVRIEGEVRTTQSAYLQGHTEVEGSINIPGILELQGQVEVTNANGILMNDQHISGLKNPVDAQDAVTKSYVDNATSSFVDLTSDQTINGRKIFNELTTFNDRINAYNQVIIDSSLLVGGEAEFNDNAKFNSTVEMNSIPTASNHVVNRKYVEENTVTRLTPGIGLSTALNGGKFNLTGSGSLNLSSHLRVKLDKFDSPEDNNNTNVTIGIASGSILGVTNGGTGINTPLFTSATDANTARNNSDINPGKFYFVYDAS